MLLFSENSFQESITHFLKLNKINFVVIEDSPSVLYYI